MARYPAILCRPPRLNAVVPRRRLARSRRPLTALVGPAGSGKTVLAVQLADAHPGAVAWCRLDPGHRAAHDVVALAAMSLGREIEVRSDDLMGMSSDLGELLETGEALLVVDDYHHASVESDRLIAELVPYLEPPAGVVLASRSRPAGVLGRVPAGMAGVVDGDDLAFTADEAVALFEAAGHPASEAERWCEETHGWAVAIAAAAHGDLGSDPSVTEVIDNLLFEDLSTEDDAVIEALGVLPYVTDEVAARLGLLAPRNRLGSLAERSALVVRSAGGWRMHDVAADRVRVGISDDRMREIRARAAPHYEVDDLPAAIELYLAAGLDERAAELLAERSSETDPDQAYEWAYRLPASLRRRLPPVVTAGRASVRLDAATLEAQERLDRATDGRARTEALLALGSVRAAAGDLLDAAAVLEQVLVEGTGTVVERAALVLGRVRWWLGDLLGAALASDRAGESAEARWLRGQIALAEGDVASTIAAGEHTLASNDASGPSLGHSLLAAAALLDGDMDSANVHAVAADAAGRDRGGLDLTWGASVHAWVLIRTGDLDAAEAICDVVERRVGSRDQHALLLTLLTRLAIVEGATDRPAADATRSAIGDIRAGGFAPLEDLVGRLLATGPASAARGLRVTMLGVLSFEVDGRPVGEWTSLKAMEVALYLAIFGPAGRRRDQAIEAVWPGRPAERGRGLLRTALTDVRRVLEPSRPAGEPSRFVVADRGRVALECGTDLDDARSMLANGDPVAAFDRLEPGLAPAFPQSEWALELERDVARMRIDAAQRVVDSEPGDPPIRRRSLEALITEEPWQRRWYELLADLHREGGDESAALAVERRWFEDD